MQAVMNSQRLISQTPQFQNEESCVIKIEMLDGTSQFVQLSLDQTPLDLEAVAHPRKFTNSANTFVNYKIVQPAELNLCTIEPNGFVPRTPLPRGRPKKRLNKGTAPGNNIETATKMSKIPKTSRTRSGRITRPPITLERDFEKILTDAKTKFNEEEIDTVQFEPLHTKNTVPKELSEEPVLVSLETNTKKRLIPSQYRCRTCKKAYLGRAKMERHLHKHPDHRLINPINVGDCKTWSFLIDTALKATKGQRGNTFCRELITLIRNARTLVRYFFKDAKQHNVEYEVDSFLAQILDIKEGLYRFNENELCKDLSIFSLLFFNEDDDAKAKQNQKPFKNSTPVRNNDDANKFQFDSIDSIDCAQIVTKGANAACNVQLDAKSKPIADLEFGADMIDVISVPKKHSPSDSSNVLPFDSVKDTNEKLTAKNEFMHIFSEDFITKTPKVDKQYEHLFENNLFIYPKSLIDGTPKDGIVTAPDSSETARNGKEVDIYRNTIKNIIDFGASNENMSTVLDKEKKARKCDDFDLNKLHLDEFHFPDAPVNNILDTSTGSDEIMNVDQFVNERFKKLTEAESEDLPSGSLQLDLPALECFNFAS